jgi:hypothetical protein
MIGPVEFIMAAFPEQDKAGEVLKKLKALSSLEKECLIVEEK